MKRRRQALSEINVTPFVDVMLVLLVIFMVTAPLLQQGIDVNLPQAKGEEMSPSERIVITVKKDGRIFLNKSSVTVETLKSRFKGKADENVFLKADRDVPYGIIVNIMGELREAGIEKLGMVTESEAKIR
jgi:biopolymer transport protein TolR